MFLSLPFSNFAAQSAHGPADNSEWLWQVLLFPDDYIFREKGGSSINSIFKNYFSWIASAGHKLTEHMLNQSQMILSSAGVFPC